MDDERETLEREKLKAEIAKIQLESKALAPRELWEGVKVVGTIVATVVAAYAGITTYRITQLETRLAETERKEAEALKAEALADIAAAEQTRAQAVAARESAIAAASKAKADKEQTEAALSDLRGKVIQLRQELQSAERTRQTADLASLRRLQRQLAEAAAGASVETATIVVVSYEPARQDVAVRIVDFLAKNGFRVRQAQRSTGKGTPEGTELHQFSEGDSIESTKIANLLSGHGLGLSHFINRNDDNRPLRYFELRLKPGAVFETDSPPAGSSR